MPSSPMESSHPMRTCDDPTFSIAAIFRRMFRNDQVAAWLLSRDLEPATMITAEMLKDSITSECRIITRETNNEENPSSQTGKRAASSSSSGAKDASAMDRGYSTTFFSKFDCVVASGNSSSSSDAVELVPRDGTAEPETIACVLHGMCGNYAFITVADTRMPFAFLERGSDVLPGVRRMVVELTHEDTFIMVCCWKANGRSSMIALWYPHDTSKISHRCFLLIAPYPTSRYPTPEDVMEVAWIAVPYRCQFCLLRGNSECECSPAVIKRTRPHPPPVERQTPWNMWSFIHGCCKAGFNRYNISLYNYGKRIGASVQVIYHINPTFENVKRHVHGYQHYVKGIEPVYTSKTLGWTMTGFDQKLEQPFVVPKLEREPEQRSDFNDNDRDADELKTIGAQDEQQEPRAGDSSLGARLSFVPSKMSLSAWMVDDVWNGTGLASKLDLLLTIPSEAARPEPKSLDSYIDIPALFGPGIASISEPSASNMLLPTTSGIMSPLITGWGTGVDSKVGASMMMPTTVQTALSDHDPQNVEQLARLPSNMKRKRRVREILPLCEPPVMEGGSALLPTSAKPCPAIMNAGPHEASAHGPTTDATNAKPRPFWSSSTRERSEKSWFSTETRFVGLDSSSASDSLKKLATNSWFSVRILQAAESAQIPSPSSPYLSSNAMEDWQLIRKHQKHQAATQQAQKENKTHDENERANDPPPKKKAMTQAEKPPVGRTRKIRLYPTREEREKLARWFGAARWTYNQALEEVRDKGCALTEKALRARVVNADALEAGGEARAWLKEVPYALRDEGLRDLLKAYKSNFAKRAKNTDHVFELKFRSKKRLDSETIVVHSAH